MSNLDVSECGSERLYEQLVENASDVIVVIDSRGIVTFANRRVEPYGLTAAGMIGRHMSEYVHPVDLPRCVEAVAQAVAGAHVTDFHFRLVTPNGAVRHMMVNGDALDLDKPDSVIAVCRDVTESIDLNEQLLARNNALSALSEIAVTLSGPAPMDDKLRMALDRILRIIGLRSAAITIKDSHGRLTIGASSEESVAEAARQAAKEDRLRIDACMERGETIVVPDLDAEGIDPIVRELSRRLGVEGCVVMPLLYGGAVKAAISLAIPRQARLNREQLEFLNLAAGILGPAIHNASLNSDLADRVNRLAMLDRLAKSINAGRDVHTVLQTCMRELAGLICYDVGMVVLMGEREADVFPYSRNGEALPATRVEMAAHQMSHIGTLDRPVTFQHGGSGIGFHTNPDTFRPSSGCGAVAPLKSQGRVFGLLKVWSNDVEYYGGREMEILESAAEHLSIAAYNVGLYEAERRRSLELAALTKETQHRIRNNLQIISGLLSMSLSNNDTSRRSLERCLRQVLAISAVHDLLSPEDMSARIRLDECLRKIGTNALQAAGRGESIELCVAGESCPVTSDTATAVGIIVNELVSNAVEHGFGERETGRIDIRIGRNDKTVAVEVIDDGDGLPQGFVMPITPNTASGLGLMMSLATYGLGGSLEMEGLERGTRARISFSSDSAQNA